MARSHVFVTVRGAEHGQAVIAQHFELCLTLGESIIDSAYRKPDPACTGQLFFVLNTESSFALGIGSAIEQLESVQAGLGEALYDSLRQSLYRWVRVYDDRDTRERIEQMTEWAESEDDPDSYEIPEPEPDLPACLRGQARRRNLRFLAYNTRFVILPWVEVPHLASHLLARVAQRLSSHWERLYHHPIYFLETFVDPERFRGTCYRAANWILLGRTTGRGKNDHTNRPNRSLKDVLGYPLTPRFRELLQET